MSHTEKLREVSEGFVNERDNLLGKYEVNILMTALLLSLWHVDTDNGKRERSSETRG